MSQHQTAVGTIANNEAGLPKSSTSASNGPLPGSSAIGAPVSSSSLPGTASAVSFNYPNLTANEALPYMAILQNNGYPFSISTHVGMPPPIKGGTHVPAMSFLGGSLYSSPVFHPSQDQPLVQPVHQLTSTSGGSSTSHRQLQSQQPQQSHPSYSSQKHELEMTGEDKSLMADKRAQKCTYTQNFAVPIQPMSFALMPSTTLGGRGSKNHGEQHQQQHGINGANLIPPQAFLLSFASFTGSGTASAHNLSSMAQNPAIFQVLPDMARPAYQIAPAAQVVQQTKNEGKTGGDSTNPDDRRTAVLGKSPTSFGQSLSFSKPGCTDPSASVIVGTTVYDSSAKTVNFISTAVPGSQPSHTIPTTMKAAPVTSNPSNSQQQQQVIQIQKQHMTQQQMHQQQLTGATQIKAQTGNSLPASSVAVKFPNNAPAFSQALMQINSSGPSSQWKNSSRNSTSQVPTSSLAVATPSTLKNVPQQKVRTSQGQTQISFGVSSNSGTALHGQQIVSNNRSAAPLVGSPPNSSISRSSGSSSRTASMGSKSGPAISVLPSHQCETSSNGPSQKSSAVCGRNVPSILSTCPSHLSELKY